MINFSEVKSIAIPEGGVVKITVNTQVLWQVMQLKNWVLYSTESDGTTIYNGGVGYKDGYRVRSGGTEAASTNTTCTGYIPVTGGDTIRFSGMPWFEQANAQNALNVSNANFENIGQFTMAQDSKYGIFLSTYKDYTASSVVEEKSGVWKWVVPPAESGIAYIRITAYDYNGSTSGKDMIVTVNEEIT